MSLVRMHRPMSVAMLQCSTVGVNRTLCRMLGGRYARICVCLCRGQQEGQQKGPIIISGQRW
jgi:hypothetical protein